MAVRVVSGSSPPSLSAFRFNHFRAFSHLRPSLLLDRAGAVITLELRTSRKRKRIRATSRVEIPKAVEHNAENQTLRQGALLQFKKESDRVLLAVALRPDGKKNWMVSDQNGVLSSIKPQQVTYIVPGVENFKDSDIEGFVQRAQNNLDPALLEFAWVELVEKNKSVTTEELAEMIFGCADPLESYSTHLLVSNDEIYFTVVLAKGSYSLYGPRPPAQVEELLRRKQVKEAAEKELLEFVQLLKSAKAMPIDAKPPKSSWTIEEKVSLKIQALESYSIDDCNEDQRKTAGLILKAMGLAKTSSSAVNLLIDIGYFPVHVNLELLKLKINTDHSEEVIAAAEGLLAESPDPDELDRKDLTHLKVYAIDVDEADELDDALSATRLQDGRIKVWIHVADPSRFLHPGNIVDRAAMSRGTSIFLPTVTYPMFPEKLAMQGMSLKQGEVCHAVTVSVVLRSDGSIAEYSVENSLIKPTYMLTHESASELLHLDLKEEAELKLLSEAATLRFQWRCEQGAIDTATLETRIRVPDGDNPDPIINLYVESQSDPTVRLVAEMMILCGEAVATYGSHNNIPLPYRGQPQSNIDMSTFAHLPDGPVRSASIVKTFRAAEFNFRNPIRHGVMGIPGYIQFTSPIRRYIDLLAHYQIKAFLRGESLPFSAGDLEGIVSLTNMQTRVVRKLCNTSLRYWILQFLRKQPKERIYHALVLRFIKDRNAVVLLIEVGFQVSAWVSKAQIGDEVGLRVVDAHPRDDFIELKEVIS